MARGRVAGARRAVGQKMIPIAPRGERRSAVQLGRRPASVGRILRPLPVRVALALARPLTPFDLEAYLNFHFTKVGPQTRLMLQTYARHAEEAGLSKSALDVLRSAL